MSDDIRQRLLAAFQAEHREYLEDIAVRLDRLGRGEAQPGDVDEVLRRAHSLKGAARAVDLPEVEALSHRLETVFVRLRDGALAFGPEIADLVRRAMDTIEDIAVAAAGDGRPADAGPVQAELDALLGQAPAPPTSPPSPSSPPPPAAPAQEPKPAPAPTPAGEAFETVRIAAGRLDSVIEAAGELLAEQHRLDVAAGALRALDGHLADLDRSWAALRRMAATILPGAFEGSSEAVTQEAGLARLFEEVEQLLNRVRRSGRTVRRLYDQASRSALTAGDLLSQELLEARMIPIGDMFGGTRKIVRDLAAAAGKQVEVEVRGLDAEADRVVLQAIRDPVLHLLRNAVGHGIEDPQERVARGKEPTGHIGLGFAVSGGRLTVTLEDDGRGFDRAAIVAAARRQGLLSAEEEPPRGRALLHLIFTPGFSTRPEVTELSGRGLGLSVVRDVATRLNGTVEAANRRRGGALFRLSIPVSATARNLLLVRVRERIFALPSDGIDRLERAHADAFHPVEGRPCVTLDERPVPVVPLAQLVGLEGAEVTASEGRVPLAVLGEAAPELALAVDEFLGLRSALVKDLGLPAPNSPAAGGILLEDGSIAIVLSLQALAAAARRLGGAPAIQTVERAPARRTPRILVVDDSLTTRTLEKSILEAHGYEVLLAVDGLEGLNRARAERPDIVIADIQMPRMDGFSLVQAIKSDPAMERTPVILVTSLDRREDRSRGLALGADAYVVKQDFDQQELLETIRQFL